ncbi:hypothetical protein HBZC1_12690 [Helicobacter bizzozeronii CIII-1]|uniref:DUF3240 domain-containing protein n=1 Tax=Helicobacter bizzozeronii (strain CIII-1) TaxID=1002804 RepID=F8KTT5_HELBC|nr:DUF3240 family protein [Helicobacter bizzozeronii]CCB80255.1 hypothetical protein HBZC1_12690 [Helicobacter bizzozeronii CIII-1]
MVILEVYADMKLKDMIVDHLLEHGHDYFYFFECFEYAAISLLKSEKEQVSGRKDYGLFKLYLEQAQVDKLAQELQALSQEIALYLLPSVAKFPT